MLFMLRAVGDSVSKSPRQYIVDESEGLEELPHRGRLVVGVAGGACVLAAAKGGKFFG